MGKISSEISIEKIIQNSNIAFIEKELIPFLKIPSNTLNPEGILKAKEFLKSYLSNFINKIEEFEGKINPLIIAKVEGEIEDSLLIYMMYDTQPVNKEKQWISPPFGAEIKKFNNILSELGDCIIARGAYNSKTPLLCFLNIIKLLKKEGQLPISLLLVIDGEEEIGSPTLLKLLEKRKDLFNSCKDSYYPSTKQDLNGNAVLKLGYKGILSFTLKVSTKNEESHSAFASMIPNAAAYLISLINFLYSDNKLNINCLSNPYILNGGEQTLIDDLVLKLDIKKIQIKAGIIQTIEEDPKKSFVNYLFNPTFNISTIKSGYLDKGIKNMVPNNAECNIDIRFAHDISIEEIWKELEELIEKFKKTVKTKIELVKNIGYEGSRANKNSILIKSLLRSFDALEISTELWPISAAAAPLSKIKKELGLNFITGGLGIGGFAHSPNEFIQLSSIINTRLANYKFLKIYSQLYKKKTR